MQEKLNKIFWLVFLFILGGVGVLFVLPTLTIRLVFGILFVGVLLWTIGAGRKTDVNTLALITAYLLSIAQFALHFYYQWPGWLILALTMVWVTVIFWLTFTLKIGNITASAKVLSVVAGLAGAQIALALIFWPTHFLITATSFFLIFYLSWMMANFYMLGILSKNRILIHVVFVGLILVDVLSTAQWTI